MGYEIRLRVVIPKDAYGWTRYKVEIESASKRRISGEAAWVFGSFYTGSLDTFELELKWNPVALISLAFSGERNIASLPQGSFIEDAYRTMLGLNISPDLTLSSIVQYETEDKALGTQTRLRWTIMPSSNLYIIYNHNWADYYGSLSQHQGDWKRGAYETKIKLDYTFQF
ncbi:MAG: hypothetical protein QNJ97_20895 [Myxococcota bacterium]|nr:hypothetical protein [Myxococcota bacterium]